MSNFLPITETTLLLKLLLEFIILGFYISPTAQYIVVEALLHVFFVVLFLANIIIRERKKIASHKMNLEWQSYSW